MYKDLKEEKKIHQKPTIWNYNSFNSFKPDTEDVSTNFWS